MDCLDKQDKWLDAIVINKRPSAQFEGEEDVMVTYPEFSKKYDEWITSDEAEFRLIK